MKALPWKRRQSHSVVPSQVSEHAAHMTTVRTTATPAAPTVSSSAERADAGRQAIADCAESFEDLRGEGDQELVELAATDDQNILKLATVGDLPADEAPYLGKFLAEQLFEDAMEAEYQAQLASYCAERHTVFTDEDAVLAYEPSDPKHPGFVDRVGA